MTVQRNQSEALRTTFLNYLVLAERPEQKGSRVPMAGRTETCTTKLQKTNARLFC